MKLRPLNCCLSTRIKLNMNINFFLNTNENLSDCNWTRTHNHLVHKRTLNHLAKLAK